MRCEVEWDGVWGSEQGSGMGNMKQVNIGNMKHVGEWNQEQGYERISRNDKAGNNGLNQARLEDHRRLHAGSEAWLELRR